MKARRWMVRFARWHIWLGWLIAVPLILWIASGLLMVARPIQVVHGDQLRIAAKAGTLPLGEVRLPSGITGAIDIEEVRTFVQRGRPITLVKRLDHSVERYDARSGARLPELSSAEVRQAVAAGFRGGDQVVSIETFEAIAPPLDLRKPVPTWQVSLADGTHVYVNRESGEIEAVRTRWWRAYDLMWGLHIMDLKTREDSHNPFVIVFGALALLGTVLGATLLFRRRKSRP